MPIPVPAPRRPFVALALSLAAAVLSAQTSQPQTVAPVFRGSATLVPLDVRVLDKQGKPVTDLTAADFAIVEDKVPQTIEHFDKQVLAPEANSTSAPLERRMTQTTTTAPRNRRVFLIVLGRGDLNGPAQGLDGLIHLVSERLLPQDYVAILAWNRASDFTTDRAAALGLLHRFKQGFRKVETDLVNYLSSPVYFYAADKARLPDYLQKEIDNIFQGPDGTAARTMSAKAATLAEATRQARDMYELFNAPSLSPFDRIKLDQIGTDLETFVQDTQATFEDYNTLSTGIEYMRHIEGEKHLVWLTEYGLRVNSLPTEFERDLARSAADARVVLSIIRAGGTEYSRGPTGAEQRGPRPVTGVAASMLLEPAKASQTIAELTGGRSDANRFPNASIAADLIDQASRAQYLLGYYPTNTNWDGRFRDVTVSVRRSGLTVLVRRCYYATNEVRALARKDVVTFSRIAAAAGEAREIPDLGLHATATKARDGKSVELRVTIDISRVQLKQNGSRNTAIIDVAAFCLDARQRPAGDHRATLELTYTDDRLAAARRDGVPVTLTIPISAPADSVKLVAYDFADDLTGSLNVKVK